MAAWNEAKLIPKAKTAVETDRRSENSLAVIRFRQGYSVTHRTPLQVYEDLYLTEQPYGLVCALETGLPASDSSSAALT